jgi:hypothetical protein
MIPLILGLQSGDTAGHLAYGLAIGAILTLIYELIKRIKKKNL